MVRGNITKIKATEQNSFTMIPVELLLPKNGQERLSWNAIALYNILASSGENFRVTIPGLCKIWKKGEHTIREAIKQLENYNFLRRIGLNKLEQGHEYLLFSDSQTALFFDEMIQELREQKEDFCAGDLEVFFAERSDSNNGCFQRSDFNSCCNPSQIIHVNKLNKNNLKNKLKKQIGETKFHLGDGFTNLNNLINKNNMSNSSSFRKLSTRKTEGSECADKACLFSKDPLKAAHSSEIVSNTWNPPTKKSKNKLQIQLEKLEQKPMEEKIVSNVISNTMGDLTPLDNQNSKMQQQINVLTEKQKERDTREAKRYTRRNKVLKYLDDNITHETLKTALKTFVASLEEANKQVTGPMLQAKLKKLTELSSDLDTQVAIVESSILNGWFNFFPLKEDQIIDNYAPYATTQFNTADPISDVELYKEQLLNEYNSDMYEQAVDENGKPFSY